MFHLIILLFLDYVYELMAIITYNLKLYPESLEYITEALKLNPNSKRLKDNYQIINQKLNT